MDSMLDRIVLFLTWPALVIIVIAVMILLWPATLFGKVKIGWRP